MRIAKRVEVLPPYLFAELDRKLAAKRAEGVDVISLGVGDPDLPTPENVVEAMREAVLDPRPTAIRATTARSSSAGRSPPGTGVVSASSGPRDRGDGAHRFEGGSGTSRSRSSIRRRGAHPDPGYPVYGVSTRSPAARRSRSRCPRTMVSSGSRRRERDRTDQGDLAELPEQPDGRGRRSRDVRASHRVRARATCSCCTTPPTARSRSTGTWRRRCCRRRTPGRRRVRLGVEVLQHDRMADRLGRRLGRGDPRSAWSRPTSTAASPPRSSEQRSQPWRRRRISWTSSGPRTSAGGIWWSERSTGSAGRSSRRSARATSGSGPRRRRRPRSPTAYWTRRACSSRPAAATGGSARGRVRFSLTVPDDRLAEAMDRIARALA